MRARARLALVVVTLVTATLGSLGLTSPASAAGVPKKGQCHQLTYAQAWAMSDAKKAVPCSARHNLETVAVVTSPTSLAGLTDDELSAATKPCIPAFFRRVGRPMTRLALSAYDLWTFVPTAAQRAAGARWIRCDVALWRGRGIAPLPRHRLPRRIVPSHVGDSIRTCLTKQKLATTCTQRHAFRAVKAFEISRASYPTRDQFIDAANRRCPAGWDYVAWAGEVSWSYGRHTVVCYDKTRK